MLRKGSKLLPYTFVVDGGFKQSCRVTSDAKARKWIKSVFRFPSDYPRPVKVYNAFNELIFDGCIGEL